MRHNFIGVLWDCPDKAKWFQIKSSKFAYESVVIISTIENYIKYTVYLSLIYANIGLIIFMMQTSFSVSVLQGKVKIFIHCNYKKYVLGVYIFCLSVCMYVHSSFCNTGSNVFVLKSYLNCIMKTV